MRWRVVRSSKRYFFIQTKSRLWPWWIDFGYVNEGGGKTVRTFSTEVAVMEFADVVFKKETFTVVGEYP